MIKTKIARILSPTRVVLAAGSDQGVQEGMEFIIYELTDPIHDPETNESLGQLELHKGRVRVIHVQERLSTAATSLRKVYRPLPFELLGREWIEEHERLPIDETTTTAVKTDLTVKVGDLAPERDPIKGGEDKQLTTNYRPRTSPVVRCIGDC